MVPNGFQMEEPLRQTGPLGQPAAIRPAWAVRDSPLFAQPCPPETRTFQKNAKRIRLPKTDFFRKVEPALGQDPPEGAHE